MARTVTKPKQAPEAPATDTRPRKTRVTAGALLSALRDVLGAVNGRSEIPILSHVLLHAEGARIALTATDLDQWVTRDLAADPQDDWRGFATCLPAKPLAKLLGELEGGAEVTLELTEGETRLTLRAGRSRFLLQQLPADDFPLAPPFTPVTAFEITPSVLLDAIHAVRHAISTETTRYYLCGIYLHGLPRTEDGQGGAEVMRMATTDGHRLARLTLPLPGSVRRAPFAPQIVPTATVALLDKLAAQAAKVGKAEAASSSAAVGPEKTPPILVEFDGTAPGSRVRCSLEVPESGEVLLVAKCIDGSFPDYARVIPSAPEFSATIDKGALSGAVRRAAVLCETKTRAVKAMFSPGKVELVVSSPELGEAREEVPAVYDGPEIAIGFNADYLVQALAALASPQVSLAFDADVAAPVLVTASGSAAVGDKGSAAGVEDAGRERLLQVLMPMRVA